MAFTIHLTLLGEKGFKGLSRLNHQSALNLREKILKISNIEILNTSFFNEFTLSLPINGETFIERMAEKRVLAGIPVIKSNNKTDNLIVVASTETNTEEDINKYIEVANEVLKMKNSNKGLNHDEPILFDIGDIDKSGVDLNNSTFKENLIGGSFDDREIGLPGLSEPESIRHYVRLSRKNYSIDAGLYPLGSCTMKHNPRLNEKLARLKGFSEVHPLQPISTCQGALELIDEISNWLKELTGMEAVTMTPKAGAQGELCGMLAIKKAIETRNENHRNKVLVPDSAHGTNPATAAFLGFDVVTIKSDENGRLNFEDFKEKVDENFAAAMITNPNTCGLFEDDIIEIANYIHDAGGYLYCDGANFNALVGKVRPGT